MVSYMNKSINLQHIVLVFLTTETFFSVGTASFKNENHSSFSANKANPQDIELPRYLKLDTDSSGSGGSSSGGGGSSSSSSGSSSGGSSSGGSSGSSGSGSGGSSSGGGGSSSSSSGNSSGGSSSGGSSSGGSGGSSGSGGGGDSSSGTDGSASAILATVTGRVGEKINGARDDLYQIYKYPDPHHWTASQWGVLSTLSVMMAVFVFGLMLLLKRSKNQHGQNEALREILIEKDDIEMRTQYDQTVSSESDQSIDESSIGYKFAERESNTPNSLNGSKLENFSSKTKFQLSPNKSADYNKTENIIFEDSGYLMRIDDNEASNIPTLLNSTKLKKQISEPYKRLKRTEFKGIRGKKQLPTLIADERFASHDVLANKIRKSRSNNIGMQKSNEENDKREWLDSIPIDRLFHITSSKFERNKKSPVQQHTGRFQQDSGKRKKILNKVDPHWIGNISTDELFHNKSHGEILLAKVNARSQVDYSPKTHEEILPLSEESEIPSKREMLLANVNKRSQRNIRKIVNDLENKGFIVQIEGDTAVVKRHRSESRHNGLTCGRDISF